uniref:Uncharacterized protein n=1 Tax=Cacopsylla melanoneura TaxID=428564 RepID=A0A8D8VPC6_9HEMI
MKTNNSTSSTMDVLQQFILAEKSSPPPKPRGNDKTSTIIPSPNKLDRKASLGRKESLDGKLDRKTSLDGNEFSDATARNGKNSNTVDVTSKASTLPRKNIAKAKDKGYEKNLDRRNGKGDGEPKVGYKQFSLKSLLGGGKSKKNAKMESGKSDASNRNKTNNELAKENGSNNGLAKENGSNNSLAKENKSNHGHVKDETRGVNPFTTQSIRDSKQSTRDTKAINDTVDSNQNGIEISDNNTPESLQNADSNDSDIVNNIDRFNDTSVSISFGRTSLKENNRQTTQDTRRQLVNNNINNSGPFVGVELNNRANNLDNSKNGTTLDNSNSRENENKEDTWISPKRSIKSATLDSGASRRRGNELFVSQEKEFVNKSATLNGDGFRGERVSAGKPPISPKSSFKEKPGTGGSAKASLKKGKFMMNGPFQLISA